VGEFGRLSGMILNGDVDLVNFGPLINGANLGWTNVIYSGTVAAAMKPATVGRLRWRCP